MITDSHPFGDAAPFVAGELGYLADRFGRVEVAPTHPRGPRHDLPSGVVLDMGLAELISSRVSCLRRAVGRRGARVLRLDLEEAEAGRVMGSSRALYESALWAGQSVGAVDWLSRRVGPRPDLLYSYWFGPAISGLAAAGSGTPLVARAHRGDLYEHLTETRRIPLRRVAMANLDLIAAVSEDGRSYLSDRYPDARAEIVVERLGVAEAPEINRPPESLVVVSCSMVKPVKRLDRLVLALKALPRQLATRTTWIHFGDGPSMQELRAGAARLEELGIHVDFRGLVSNSSVTEAFASEPISVLVNTSDSEGVPVSIMEAQAAGIPVVATPVGGTSEIVDDSVGRLLADPDSATELASKIVQVAREFNTVEARRAVVNRWAEYSSADRNYTAFADRLHRLAERGTAGTVRA